MKSKMSEMGLIVLDGAKEFGEKVDGYLKELNQTKNSFILDMNCPRFGTGEAKCHISESVRGKDIYILLDICNYSIKYTVCGIETVMSPDDHYQDLKRVISAISGKARRISVIMPFLYESRQHKRSSRESLDCALMLHELENMGVDNIITFDAHDPRVQNALFKTSFESVPATYQFIKTLLTAEKNVDLNEFFVISPDEGATSRAIFLSNMLGVNMGMFYKRRDFTKVVDGRNPIVAHEFLGESVEGRRCIIIDDMISSGDSVLDVAKQLKSRGAKEIIVLATFGLFTSGLEKFDKAYEEGLISKILTTNLIYQKPELFEKEYYYNVDMSEYVAAIINNLSYDNSLSELINPTNKIQKFIRER